MSHSESADSTSSHALGRFFGGALLDLDMKTTPLQHSEDTDNFSPRNPAEDLNAESIEDNSLGRFFGGALLSLDPSAVSSQAGRKDGVRKV